MGSSTQLFGAGLRISLQTSSGDTGSELQNSLPTKDCSLQASSTGCESGSLRIQVIFFFFIKEKAEGARKFRFRNITGKNGTVAASKQLVSQPIEREAGDVWCLPPVWNLRAVIWFHFAISSLVLLPSPVTLSVFSFSACWPFLLNFFQKIPQYFSLRDRLFCMAPV